MTDHETKLLKWVAEELLGWIRTANAPEFDGWIYRDSPNERHFGKDLESWHGIGLVVEAMNRRGFEVAMDNFTRSGEWVAIFEPKDMPGKPMSFAKVPWFAVYEAARKAVTND